jgi:Amt family ammonium transporter
LILVYAPICHWVWGGGWLSELGVMDFAGGIVVHITGRLRCIGGCHGAG